MKNNRCLKKILLLMLTCTSVWSYADIRLPAILSNHMVLQQNSNVKLWGYADPYEKVSIHTSWDGKSYEVTGSRNAEWQVIVPTPPAEGPYYIEFKGNNIIKLEDVLIGEVWVCGGQSNMEMSGNWGLKDIKEELPRSSNQHIRFFHVPKRTAKYPQEGIEGNWVVCDSTSLKSFSAAGYFFGKQINGKLKVPVGLVEASWGGSAAEVWTPDSLISADPVLKKAANRISPSGMVPYQPGYAFNAMIAPITPYVIAGVIWYQGENNTETAGTYQRLFTKMIDAWRKAWGKDLPFYYVQIAPFRYAKVNTGALLREAQLQSMAHPNTGMVVTTDLVTDVNNVHPENKHDVGLRLANWALAKTYHQKVAAYQSPVYQKIRINKNKAEITIDHAPAGLIIKGNTINDLQISGIDKKFYPAKARLKDNRITVWSDSVKQPIAVRYGFHDTAIGNVFSKEGLPLAPFRTDGWAVENEYCCVSYGQQRGPLPLIPQPATVQSTNKNFKLDQRVTLSYNDGAAKKTAILLNDFLFLNYGFRLKLKALASPAQKRIAIVHYPRFKNESYTLNIQQNGVKLSGGAAGIFYGLQTLQQLCPLGQKTAIILPGVNIEDTPRFAHRGLMLDVSRHFFPVSYIKKFLDLMAHYKFNNFHWHLTDDQGWRIEIKKHPELQEVAAWRRPTSLEDQSPQIKNGRYGGYYTQQQIKEVVAYAAARHINIIPEIEMPGHSNAALAAYPALGCVQQQYEVLTGGTISSNVYCAGNDQVFKFLQDVIDEVVTLFPGKYIHIGGDETPKDRWKACPKCQARIKAEGLKDELELQSYFVHRMEKYINSKGRQIIGWDEILEGGLAPNATVMSWRGETGGIEAARLHHDVIMTPYPFVYFDYCQGSHRELEPHATGDYTPLSKVYSYDPVPSSLTADQQKYIKGVQANTWAEQIPNEDHADYMVFPRALAVAEIGWSPVSKKNYPDFLQRLSVQLANLDRQHVNFRIPEPIDLKDSVTVDDQVIVDLKPSVENANVYYTIDGSTPTVHSTKSPGAVNLSLSDHVPVTLKAITVLPSGRQSAAYTGTYKKM